MKTSPNRFTKTSQGRSWNTGNGSPDAICLTVDKPGVVLVGVCVYGGGGIHEYELEVLADDVSNSNLFLGFSSFVCFLPLLFCHPPCADGAPRRLGAFSQMDISGIGEGHLQH